MVADAQGNALADRHAPIPYFTPDGESELTREFHPQEMLDTAIRLTADSLAQAHVTPSNIAAIAITSQRHGVVFLDDDGRELMVSPNVDLRAAFEGATLQDEMGASLYETTGQFPAMLLAPAKLRWLENNRPDIHKKVTSILTIAGWLAFKLTNTPASEPSLAAGIGLLNLRTFDPSHTRHSAKSRNPETAHRKLPSKMPSPPSLLPPLSPAGEIVGNLSPDATRQFGLPPHTPITLAGADSSTGLVGMGLTNPGQTGLIAGWSATIQTLTDSPKPDSHAKVWFSPSPIPGRWLSETNLGDAGNAHRWLKNLILGPNATFTQADALAASAPVGSNGALAYLGSAPLSAPEAGLRRGGLLFPTPLQYREPTRADALRSFWESLAYSVKANLSTLERASNRTSSVLHLGGGMARSPLFAQILASVTKRKIRRSASPHVTLRGTIASAFVAAGLHPNLTDASQAMTPQWLDTYPNPSDTLEYQDFYQQWKTLYHKIQHA